MTITNLDQYTHDKFVDSARTFAREIGKTDSVVRKAFQTVLAFNYLTKGGNGMYDETTKTCTLPVNFAKLKMSFSESFAKEMEDAIADIFYLIFNVNTAEGTLDETAMFSEMELIDMFYDVYADPAYVGDEFTTSELEQVFSGGVTDLAMEFKGDYMAVFTVEGAATDTTDGGTDTTTDTTDGGADTTTDTTTDGGTDTTADTTDSSDTDTTTTDGSSELDSTDGGTDTTTDTTTTD